MTNDEEMNAMQYVAFLESQKADLLTALEGMEHPEGAYNRDPVKYRDNVIADMQEKARAAIARARGILSE